MDEILNKPLLEQLYYFRKESFEKLIHDNNKEIRDIERKSFNYAEELTEFLKKVIAAKKDYENAEKIFMNYDYENLKQIEFWSCIYYKLGMCKSEKLGKELLKKGIEVEDENTFLNYKFNEFTEWIEDQKAKYIFKTKEYKELQSKYDFISEQYPKAALVLEDLKPIELNKEEMKALVQLHEIEIELGYIEKKLYFKLGMKEAMSL